MLLEGENIVAVSRIANENGRAGFKNCIVMGMGIGDMRTERASPPRQQKSLLNLRSTS